jgi:hypothetical protein
MLCPQNIVLENTCERIIAGGEYRCEQHNSPVHRSPSASPYVADIIFILILGKYCDIHLGVYIVRGDNITLLCEIDEEKEKNEMPLEKVEPEDLPEMGDKDDGVVQWNFE